MNREIWLPIVGFNGNYLVSSFGRVKSLAREVTYKDGRKRITNEMLLKVSSKQGYPSVSLPGGKRTCVHTLVAEAFIGPKPKSARTVNHLDGNKQNNRAENLEWASYAENNRHARLVNLNKQHGEKCNLTRFGDDSVDAVRILWASKRFTQIEIANLFSMSETHVGEITRMKSRVRKTTK